MADKKVATRMFGEVQYQVVIPEGGKAGGIAEVFPAIPDNDLAVEIFKWVKEELVDAGKRPQQSYYYPHPKDPEERKECIPYGKLSVLFLR